MSLNKPVLTVAIKLIWPNLVLQSPWLFHRATLYVISLLEIGNNNIGWLTTTKRNPLFFSHFEISPGAMYLFISVHIWNLWNIDTLKYISIYILHKYVTQYNKRYILSTFELSNYDIKLIQIKVILLKIQVLPNFL